MNTIRFGALATPIDDRRGQDNGLPLLSVSQYRGVIRRSEISDDAPRATDLSNYKVCRSNDLVINRMSAYQGAVGLAQEDGIVSPDYLVLRPTPAAQPRYLAYLAKSNWFVGEMTSRLRGIGTVGAQSVRTPRVSFDELKAIQVLDVPAATQIAISDLLDQETAKIDALITKQDQLMGALAERRSALIFDAVTRGLDPLAEMKDGRVNWPGQVPVTWTVGNIRRFAAMKTGHTPSRSRTELWENCDIPWFTLADVWQLRDGRQTYLGETKEQVSRLGITNSAAELLPARTVVLSRTASIGFSGIMPRPMATSQDFWNWVCGPELLPEYLLFVFRAMAGAGEFRRMMTGSTHQTIYQPVAAAMQIPVPPRPDQAAIVEFLSEQTGVCDSITDTVRQFIDLMRERRAALITALLTGQIDVATYGQGG
jgi:type I restriction enzyme S subunit